MSRAINTSDDAVRLLAELGATPWLVRHHELVLEAAVVLCKNLGDVTFESRCGARRGGRCTTGKIVHPREMTEAGSEHEAAGRAVVDRARGGRRACAVLRHPRRVANE